MLDGFVGKITVQVVADTGKFKKGISESTKMVNSFESSTRMIGISVSRIGSAITGFGVAGASAFASISAASIGATYTATKIAMDWESAFTNVIKVLGDSKDGFKSVEKGIRDMTKEIPMAAEEIAAIAESAARLGVKEDDIIKFTRTVADLGVTTNMAADEASEAFARFANITGMSLDDVDRLGSTVVNLGNNLATSEKEITNMGLRIGAAGRQAGLSEAEIMSFAGAISATGIRAEAGGTAFTRVLQRIRNYTDEGGEQLEILAKTSGITAKEFAESFRKDPANAILEFLEGLNKMEEAGGNTSKVLDELGFSDIRVKDTLLRAAGASDMFAEALDYGTSAWEKNDALVNEANLRYSTFASQLQILKNRVVDMIRSAGLPLLEVFKDVIKALDPVLSLLEGLMEKFNNANPKIQKFIGYILIGVSILSAIAAAIFGVIAVIGGLVVGIGLLIAGLGTFGASALLVVKVSAIVIAVLAGIAAVVGGVIIAFGAVVARSQEMRDLVVRYFTNLKNTVIELFNILIEFFKGAWDIIKDFWENDLKVIADIVTNFFKSIFNTEKNTSGFEAIIKSARKLKDGLLNAFSAALKGITKFVKFIEPFLQTLAKSFREMREKSNPAIDSLVSGFEKVVPLLKVVWNIVKLVAAVILGALAAAINAIVRAFQPFINTLASVIEFLGALGGYLASVFTLDFDGMASGAKGLGKILLDIFYNLLDTLNSLIMGFFEGLFALIFGKSIDLQAEIIRIWDSIASFFTTVNDAIRNTVLAVWTWIDEKIIQTVVNIYNKIKDFFTKSKESAENTWEETRSGVISKVIDLYTGIVEWLTNAYDKVVQVWSVVKDFMVDVWNSIVETVLTIVSPFIDILTEGFTKVSEHIIAIWDGMVQYTAAIWDLIKNLVLGAVLLLINLVTGDLEEFKANAIAIWDNIKDALGRIWDSILEIITNTLGAILTIVDTQWKLMLQYIETVLDLMWEAIKKAWDLIVNAFTTSTDFISTAIEKTFKFIGDVIKMVMDGIKAFAQAWWDNFRINTYRFLESINNAFKTIWNGIYKFFTEIIPKSVRYVNDKFVQMASAIWEAMKKAWQFIKDVWNDIMDFFRSIDLKQIGKDIINGLIKGITSMVANVQRAVKKVTDAVTGKIKDILRIASPSKVMERFGVWTGEGFADGIQNQVKNVSKVAGRLAEAAKPDIKESIALDYATPDSMYSSLTSAVKGTVDVNNKDERLINAVESLGDRIEAMEVVMDGTSTGKVLSPYIKKETDKKRYSEYKQSRKGRGYN